MSTATLTSPHLRFAFLRGGAALLAGLMAAFLIEPSALGWALALGVPAALLGIDLLALRGRRPAGR